MSHDHFRGLHPAGGYATRLSDALGHVADSRQADCYASLWKPSQQVLGTYLMVVWIIDSKEKL